MFDRLLKLRTAIYHVLHDAKCTKVSECVKLELSPADWIVIEELIPAMYLLFEATEALATVFHCKLHDASVR